MKNMKNFRKFKVLKQLDNFNVGTIITNDWNIGDMYHGVIEGLEIDACIVENCPTIFEEVFEEIFKKPYEIIKNDNGQFLGIVRKSDEKMFYLEDNFIIDGEKAINIIDDFILLGETLYIVENDINGENKLGWKVEEILEKMQEVNYSSNKELDKEEIMKILEELRLFYYNATTKISQLLNK